MRMTFSPLENSVLMEVAAKPCLVTELYEKYVEKKRCSRAGFYKTLSSLKAKEVVTDKDGLLAVNKIWLAEANDFFARLVTQKSTPSYLAEEVKRLDEGDRLSYDFHDIAEVDIFILNLLYDLILLRPDEKILILEPHEFFVLLNDNRTERIMNELDKGEAKVHLLIESDSAIDKAVVRGYLPRPAEGYVSGKKSNDSSRLTHVVGDVCIELRLNKSLASSIDRLYSTADEVNETLVDGLRELMTKRRKHQIVIYRNKNKANKMRGRFKKYF